MDLNQFITTVIENAVATVPAIVVVVSPILMSLKKVKETTNKFPTTLDQTKTDLLTQFKDSTVQLDKTFQDTKSQMETLLTKTTEDISNKVNGELEGMKTQLGYYEKTLHEQKEQSNILAQENKAFMAVIAAVASKDPEKVRSGVSKIVGDQFDALKLNLKDRSILLEDDVNKLKQTLIQAKSLLSEEQYEKLLSKVNDEYTKSQESII